MKIVMMGLAGALAVLTALAQAQSATAASAASSDAARKAVGATQNVSPTPGVSSPAPKLPRQSPGSGHDVGRTQPASSAASSSGK